MRFRQREPNGIDGEGLQQLGLQQLAGAGDFVPGLLGVGIREQAMRGVIRWVPGQRLLAFL